MEILLCKILKSCFDNVSFVALHFFHMFNSFLVGQILAYRIDIRTIIKCCHLRTIHVIYAPTSSVE